MSIYQISLLFAMLSNSISMNQLDAHSIDSKDPRVDTAWGEECYRIYIAEVLIV